jgi:hypothetical protein
MAEQHTGSADRVRQVLRDLVMLHNTLMQQLTIHLVNPHCKATNPQVTQTVALYNLLHDLVTLYNSPT